jgi:ubiquinol-cytochrome c reductase cytochrome c subunit
MTGRLHRLLVAAPLLVTALATPLAVAASPDQEGGDDQLAEGRELYLTGCSSCHGPDGGGVDAPSGLRGPSLIEAGEAGAYYYLSTGRMPLASSEEQPARKDPAYTPEQIDALVAYIASLDDGPELPDVDASQGDVADGGVIFRANCQACHSASGSGGALSYGRAAPRLSESTPRQVGAAVRSGPGQMPVFGPEVITDDQLNDLARYVEYLHDPSDPGGIPIGRTGPIPEGFVAWLIALPALLALVAWIGTRSPIRRAGHAAPASATTTATTTTAEGEDD